MPLRIFILDRLVMSLIGVICFRFCFVDFGSFGYSSGDFHFSSLISLARTQTWVLDRRWKL